MTPEQFEQAKREFAERWGRLDCAPDANMYEELTALLEQHKEMMLEFAVWATKLKSNPSGVLFHSISDTMDLTFKDINEARII